MPQTTLHAWATPAWTSGSPVDHTWVTTYDNQQNPYANVAAVTAAGQDYWFCWGGFHAQGGTPVNPTGALGHQAGNLSLARCLVQSNADSRSAPAARGTIYVYGVDGVCHQLANQVLYATGGRPLTVRRARGYGASSFLYGTYGLQHAAWASKIASCTAATAIAAGGAPAAGPAGGSRGALKDPDLQDDFEENAREVLGGEPEVLARLLALRSEVTGYLAQKIPGVQPPDARTLNARNQHLLDEAARLLDADRFMLLFGFRPGETIDLVDPTIADGEPDK